jgi:flagellar protein FliO/FliZ
MNYIFLVAVLQQGPEEINFGMLILRMLIFLALVIALIYFLLRKVLPSLMRMTTFKNQTIRILERVPLDQRRSMLVVEIQDKVYLVGCAEGQINILMELDREKLPAKPAFGQKSSRGFDEILKKTLLRMKPD